MVTGGGGGGRRWTGAPLLAHPERVTRWFPVWVAAVAAAAGCGTSDPAGDDDDADPAGPPELFALPVARPELLDTPVMGVDHDPDVYEGAYQVICASYADLPFPHCYDGHEGSDLLLSGGFATMDDGSAEVIAAAAGQVVAVEDGHYDRCHGSIETFEVDCDGQPMIANSVIVEHPSGIRTLYWHFMKDSIVVEEGQEVDRGDLLGLIGSSGMSSQPHLHFGVVDVDGAVIDPFAGDRSQPESWWCDQGGVDDLPGSCDP